MKVYRWNNSVVSMLPNLRKGQSSCFAASSNLTSTAQIAKNTLCFWLFGSVPIKNIKNVTNYCHFNSPSVLIVKFEYFYTGYFEYPVYKYTGYLARRMCQTSYNWQCAAVNQLFVRRTNSYSADCGSFM